MTPAQQIAKLKEENTELKRLLEVCNKWMKREIHEKAQDISRGASHSEKEIERVGEKISEFFGEVLLINGPTDTIELLIESELHYKILSKNPDLDGLSVVNAYQKILEKIIEEGIVGTFRKSFRKPAKPHNHILEKTLYNVVYRKYRLSVGKFFEILQSQGQTGLYVSRFKEVLSESIVGPVFMSEENIKALQKLIDRKVFSAKRHDGKVSLEDVRFVRKHLVGNYTDTHCLFYQLLDAHVI